MDDLLEFTLFGLVALPTFVMSAWAWGRRFAHLPLLGLALTLGALLSFRVGQFANAASLDPAAHRCGLFVDIALIGLGWIGAWVLLAGLVLLIWRGTRSVGLRLLLWGLPLYVVTCTVAGLVGRYAG